MEGFYPDKDDSDTLIRRDLTGAAAEIMKQTLGRVLLESTTTTTRLIRLQNVNIPTADGRAEHTQAEM